MFPKPEFNCSKCGGQWLTQVIRLKPKHSYQWDIHLHPLHFWWPRCWSSVGQTKYLTQRELQELQWERTWLWHRDVVSPAWPRVSIYLSCFYLPFAHHWHRAKLFRRTQKVMPWSRRHLSSFIMGPSMLVLLKLSNSSSSVQSPEEFRVGIVNALRILYITKS